MERRAFLATGAAALAAGSVSAAGRPPRSEAQAFTHDFAPHFGMFS